MVELRTRWLAAALLAAALGCGGGARAVTAPSGSGERREALLARVVAEPGDVTAWRALAAEEDRAGRSAAALDALEQVLLRRGPLGDDLSLADRRRLGRLLYERGALRLARGAASALDDLRRSARYEWPVKAEELRGAEIAQAVALLKHSEARQRAAGMAKLAELAERPEASSTWRGARAQATVEQRAELGRWLWRRGAKRAGYELMAPQAERTGGRLSDEERDLYLEARAWWAPSWRGDAGLPTAERVTGPRRCALVAPGEAAPWKCDVLSVKSATFRSTPEEQDALRGVPAPPERDAAKASAWVAMVVRGYLEGDGWGSKVTDPQRQLARRLDDLPAELARRVDLAWVTAPERREQLAPFARPTLLRLAGDFEAAHKALAALTSPSAGQRKPLAALSSVERLVVAYEEILATAAVIPASASAPRASTSSTSASPASASPASASAAASPRSATPASASPTNVPPPLVLPPPPPPMSAEVEANRAAVGRVIDRLPLPEGRGDPPAVMRLRTSLDVEPSPQLTRGSASRSADDAAAQAALVQLGNDWVPDKQARLVAIARAARRDVAVAHRKAAEHVALSPDAALAWGELGALYLLLDDPASARAAWQRAVDASDEPELVHGLALATAAAKDPDAALLFLVKAAAASGDPSPVLIDGAEALLAAGSALHALQAAKSAIELATPDTARRALAVAYRASSALGRHDDAAQLVRLGATVPPELAVASSGKRTEEATLEELRRAALADLSSAARVLRWAAADPSPEATYALWRTAQWNRSNVAVYDRLLHRLDADDPRRSVVIDVLVGLSHDPDRAIVAAAVAALRQARD